MAYVVAAMGTAKEGEDDHRRERRMRSQLYHVGISSAGPAGNLTELAAGKG